MIPSWEDPDLGTMKRVALWLVSVVGAGNEFTKEDLRQAFPGVSQVDRRMRDLRDFEWRIDTNREDPTLEPHEQRFVRAGIPVWEPGRASRNTAISAARRREIIANDGNMCRSCGITPGALYEGTFEAAQLDIARRDVRRPDGTMAQDLVTECNRCRVGGRGLTADLDDVLRRAAELSPIERRVFIGWIAADRREFSRIEELWGRYRSLPGESRAAVGAELGQR